MNSPAFTAGPSVTKIARVANPRHVELHRVELEVQLTQSAAS